MKKFLFIILFALSSTFSHADDVTCLSHVIWHEARGEPEAGKRAVAEVVLNRVESGKFGSDVCSVIYWPGQFSGISKRMRGDFIDLASDILSGNRMENFPYLYFRHKSLPGPVRARIGAHVFR